MLAVYDHTDERSWRHLDSCAFMTFPHASPPRVACPDHGVRQARLPWAEPHSRFTMLFERLATDVLVAFDVAWAAKLLRISWDEAWHLMDRAVARGLAAKPASVPVHLGVDEKAAGDKSLADSKYLWLYSAENLPARHHDRFAALRAGNLKTARAWAIKDGLRHLWSYCPARPARIAPSAARIGNLRRHLPRPPELNSPVSATPSAIPAGSTGRPPGCPCVQRTCRG